MHKFLEVPICFLNPTYHKPSFASLLQLSSHKVFLVKLPHAIPCS
jgi:hypothetical protein